MIKKNNPVSMIVLSIVTCLSWVYAQKDYGVHDPSTIVKENDRYYTFYTSNGVEYAYSTDLCTWRRSGAIFPSGFPSWIKTHVSGFAGHFWAPDVFYMNNRWNVYYSCSSFGSRQSAIGLATTTSLRNPKWEDKGMVVSTTNSSNHNAIDAAIMRHDGKVWLAYGSFWSGIVITELDSTTGKPVRKDNLKYIANNDPEAAGIIHHGDYYYLFFNRGKCCDGVKSTYYINVGRSTSPTGPYLDKNGKSTSSGGGTTILKTQGRYIGPGHFGFFTENGKEYMSYHFYDKNQNGASKLKISTLSWKDGWPEVNTDFNPCTPVAINNCIEVKRNGPFNAGYADGKITFFMEKESSVNMHLFTVSGKVVLSTVSRGAKAGVNHLQLNACTLSRGLYLFVLEQNSGLKYEKLISIM
ncbi:MAG: arabinan endo-1,5-alpha-L-arabinosidase [Chitinispirillaceae bacterium]|nr:arabinan endo-1,5-alpha-L-arabinosidase [Chitinispirillaceae bacterium]